MYCTLKISLGEKMKGARGTGPHLSGASQQLNNGQWEWPILITNTTLGGNSWHGQSRPPDKRASSSASPNACALFDVRHIKLAASAFLCKQGTHCLHHQDGCFWHIFCASSSEAARITHSPSYSSGTSNPTLNGYASTQTSADETNRPRTRLLFTRQKKSFLESHRFLHRDSTSPNTRISPTRFNVCRMPNRGERLFVSSRC